MVKEIGNSGILTSVKMDNDVHYQSLFSYINSAFEDNEYQRKEFEKVLIETVESVKRTGQIELINSWCGHFDLLVTPERVHLVLIHKSFKLPEIDEVSPE
ncbi:MULTISPECIES: hypothetical protein [Bacillus amyloliquefaciens group]|uniref:hypothetical protein n=1 Tax=Bacillus amyloliquefaciens group TaxID=1938374 RepID=UPI00073B8A58|nr:MULTISPECIES: hypothetical protein [Bacillus amyloliquefaciens group]KTF59877.1 hypothetical protein AR691_14200 [Bacillus amyloliquefaciens]